jgi:exodeoxyribonuclease VII small subunit
MSDSKSPRGKARPFDEILKELEGVVSRLEQGDLPLEEALLAFEQGVNLTREGERILAAAEERVELLLEGRGGELETAPFEKGAAKDPR